MRLPLSDFAKNFENDNILRFRNLIVAGFGVGHIRKAD